MNVHVIVAIRSCRFYANVRQRAKNKNQLEFYSLVMIVNKIQVSQTTCSVALSKSASYNKHDLRKQNNYS